MGVTSWIRRQFRSGVIVTDYIPAGLTSGATSFTAHDGTTFPDGSIGNFIITVDQGLATEEQVLIQSRSGSVFTVASGGRGYGPAGAPAAQGHGPNCSILATINAQDFDEANQVAVQTLGAIAAKGDLLVGSSANNLAKLSIGSTNQFLTVQSGTLAYQSFGSGGTTAIAASGSDGVAVGPARYDHTHSGVTTVNGSAGAVTVVATFNGATGAISQSNGYGITGANSNPPTPAVALSNAAGHLVSDYTITGSQATFLTTASLAAGTWLIQLHALVDVVAGGSNQDITTVVGTATATFEGCYSAEMYAGDAADNPVNTVGLSFIATVSVAGTLVFQAKSNGSNNLIKATTVLDAFANATGYTAVRIA